MERNADFSRQHSGAKIRTHSNRSAFCRLKSAFHFGKSTVRQPFVEAGDPTADGFEIARAQAEAVAAARIDMKFRRHTDLFEFQVDVRKTLRNIQPIVVSANKEHGRRIL